MYQHDLSDCCVETELQSKVTRLETKSLVMRFIQRTDDGGLQYKGRNDSFFSGIFKTNKVENIFGLCKVFSTIFSASLRKKLIFIYLVFCNVCCLLWHLKSTH